MLNLHLQVLLRRSSCMAEEARKELTWESYSSVVYLDLVLLDGMRVEESLVSCGEQSKPWKKNRSIRSTRKKQGSTVLGPLSLGICCTLPPLTLNTLGHVFQYLWNQGLNSISQAIHKFFFHRVCPPNTAWF